MDKTKESDEMHLISNLSNDTNYTQEHKTNNLATAEVNQDDQGLLNLKESAFVMLGIVLGAGILLQPYVIRQLGILGWLGCLILTITTYSIMAVLLGKSTVRVLEENDAGSLVRDPFQLVAEQSCGRIMRLVLVVFFYFTLFTNCMALLLLASSILSNLIPIPHMNHIDIMRVWSTVLVGLLTPITYLGTYTQLKLPALLAITTSLSSACLILVNSLLYRFAFTKPNDFNQIKIQNADQIFFIPVGTVLFSAAGTFLAPNIVTVATSRSEIHKSFIGAYACLFVALSVSGIVPYLVFGDLARSNTVSTFYSIINNGSHEHDHIRAFLVITTLIDVLMMLHLCTAIVLLMNPLFLHMENSVGIPHEFTIKRVGVRTTFMVFVLAVCLLLPHFEPILSLSGGIPLVFVGIVIPLFIYINLFPTPRYQKIFIYIFLLALAAIVAGNLVASIQQMITLG